MPEDIISSTDSPDVTGTDDTTLYTSAESTRLAEDWKNLGSLADTATSRATPDAIMSIVTELGQPINGALGLPSPKCLVAHDSDTNVDDANHSEIVSLDAAGETAIHVSVDGTYASREILVAMVDRPAEMSDLIKHNPGFFALLRRVLNDTTGHSTSFKSKKDDQDSIAAVEKEADNETAPLTAYEELLQILSMTRSQLPDRAWVHAIGTLLEGAEPLFEKFKDMVGFDADAWEDFYADTNDDWQLGVEQPINSAQQYIDDQERECTDSWCTARTHEQLGVQHSLESEREGESGPVDQGYNGVAYTESYSANMEPDRVTTTQQVAEPLDPELEYPIWNSGADSPGQMRVLATAQEFGEPALNSEGDSQQSEDDIEEILSENEEQRIGEVDEQGMNLCTNSASQRKGSNPDITCISEPAITKAVSLDIPLSAENLFLVAHERPAKILFRQPPTFAPLSQPGATLSTGHTSTNTKLHCFTPNMEEDEKECEKTPTSKSSETCRPTVKNNVEDESSDSFASFSPIITDKKPTTPPTVQCGVGPSQTTVTRSDAPKKIDLSGLSIQQGTSPFSSPFSSPSATLPSRIDQRTADQAARLPILSRVDSSPESSKSSPNLDGSTLVIGRLRDSEHLVQELPLLQPGFFRTLRLAFRYGPSAVLQTTQYSTHSNPTDTQKHLAAAGVMTVANTTNEWLNSNKIMKISDVPSDLAYSRMVTDAVDEDHDAGYDTFMEVLNLSRSEVSDEEWESGLRGALEPFSGFWESFVQVMKSAI